MKTFSLFVLFLFLCLQLHSQTITGKVFDASNGEPFIYVNIGVIETTKGTITNKQGNFYLEVKDIPTNSLARFSMIGYKSQTYTIEELT